MSSNRTPTNDRSPSPENVLVVRPLGGANCSSVGSVVDALFVTSVVGGALMTAVTVALATERVRVVGAPAAPARGRSHEATPGEGHAGKVDDADSASHGATENDDAP